MNTTGKMLTAVAAGAAIGGLLGVLFAPDKGIETRKKISEKSKEIADAAKEKLEQFRHGHHNGVKEKEFTS